MVAAPAATSVQGWRNAARPAAPQSESWSRRAIQAGGFLGWPIRRRWRRAIRISTTPAASLTARAASDGTVFGSGGLLPVETMTAAMTAIRQASQPRMNARPVQVPLSELSTRMKAVSGNGSRVMASPMSSRSSTTPPLPCVRAARPSQTVLGGYPPGLRRVDQGLVVTLVLIGVGDGELRDGAVEDIRAAKVGGDGDAVAGAGVPPGQRPAAQRAVQLESLRPQELDFDGEFPVPQLADVEVPGAPVKTRLHALPAQEDVAGRLHQPLAGHHPLALVGVPSGADEPAEH